jgi:hypothetical protein
VEVHLELGAGNPLAVVLEVPREALDHAGGIDLRPAARDEQVEEVAALLALVERAQLCPRPASPEALG